MFHYDCTFWNNRSGAIFTHLIATLQTSKDFVIANAALQHASRLNTFSSFHGLSGWTPKTSGFLGFLAFGLARNKGTSFKWLHRTRVRDGELPTAIRTFRECIRWCIRASRSNSAARVNTCARCWTRLTPTGYKRPCHFKHGNTRI